MRNILSELKALFILTAMVFAAGCASGHSTSLIEAKNMKNPVPATPQSIASGKNVYTKYCAECHGVTGNGDSAKAKTLAEAGAAKPSDLTDDKWDHGSTDGEIFVNIRDGVGVNGAMKGLDGRPGISDDDMWNVVNYVRTLKKN
jgi:cytochrome c